MTSSTPAVARSAGPTSSANLTSHTGPAGRLMSPDQVAGELRSGMTIGIGGWGSRRKPMALVRAILRAGLDDLTVVS